LFNELLAVDLRLREKIGNDATLEENELMNGVFADLGSDDDDKRGESPNKFT